MYDPNPLLMHFVATDMIASQECLEGQPAMAATGGLALTAAPNMKRCHCGARRSTAPFCEECGGSSGRLARHCGQCGTASVGRQFCGDCGASLLATVLSCRGAPQTEGTVGPACSPPFPSPHCNSSVCVCVCVCVLNLLC